MLKFAMRTLLAALAAGTAGSAFAADIIDPPAYEPAAVVTEYPEADFGGWYIRGDIDGHWAKVRGTEYVTYGVNEFGNPYAGTSRFDSTDLKGAFSIGGGVGYQVNRYFRTDVTADYWFKSKFKGSTAGFCGGVPCVSVDETSFSALLLLANAYAEFGTYHGITPYVGVGIGGAHVKWDDLRNTIDDVTERHKGAKNWRFAYALMAGASYCLTNNLKFDAGYRFSRIEGGRMFQEYGPSGGSIGVGPGFDKGFNTHEVRAGLRYQFGKSDCVEPEVVAYEPEPVYTK